MKEKSHKDKRIILRVSHEEKEIIRMNAKGEISDWLRQLGLKKVRKVPKVIKQDPDLINEVRAIGNCLNQLTRNINHCTKTSNSFDVAEFNAYLSEINTAISMLARRDVS